MFTLLPHRPAWRDRVRPVKPTLRYLLETEVHVYAFSMAANLLLSFFPFMIVMISLCRYVLEWREAEQAIYLALSDSFPEPLGPFLQRNLRATVASRGPFQVVSILLLLFTANGIFEPLEVALNRAWGFATNRSYFRNLLVSLGLIMVCGGLALVSYMLAALTTPAAFKMGAIPLFILALFLVYWLLPNGKVQPMKVLPAAACVGVGLEVFKYLNLWTWPWLRVKLTHEYGPFVYSVTIILWGFLSSLLVLAGAEWAARPDCKPEPESIDSSGN